MMRTKAKLVLASCGAAMMVAVGISVAGLYTYHHDANLHGQSAAGSAPLTIGTLPDQQLLGVADSTAGLQDICIDDCGSKATVAAAHDAVSPAIVFAVPSVTAHDNGNSPFDDPTKALSDMGSNNPAVLRGLPAFLR